MGETFPSNSLSAQLGTSNSGVSGAGTGTGKHSPGGTRGCPHALARISEQAWMDEHCPWLCSHLLPALGSPGEARSSCPRFLGPAAQAGWAARAARRVRGIREVFGCHPSLPVTSGLSLGDFQHCSFHFSAAGEAAYGGLKGINDA